jgi:hypothetical protein
MESPASSDQEREALHAALRALTSVSAYVQVTQRLCGAEANGRSDVAIERNLHKTRQKTSEAIRALRELESLLSRHDNNEPSWRQNGHHPHSSAR